MPIVPAILLSIHLILYLFLLCPLEIRWAKDILQMSEEYEYLGLEIVNSKISKNKERATVLFRALFKKDNAYMAVEENAIFLRFKGDIKEGFSGRTVYSKDGKNPINTAPVSAKFDTTAATNNKWSADADSSVPLVKKENEQIRCALFNLSSITFSFPLLSSYYKVLFIINLPIFVYFAPYVFNSSSVICSTCTERILKFC